MVAVTRIVVGVDASDGAIRALDWAADEARLRGARLELVHAFPTPELVALPSIVTLPSDEELRHAAEQVIADTVLKAKDLGNLEVQHVVAAGGPASVLCEVAEGAELLVVGARGLGGFRGLLLGSVTHQVVTHSPCPVVVIVPERR